MSVGTAQESPAPQQRESITGFKFLRLGMTLEELLRMPVSEVDVARQVDCIEDDQAMFCAIRGQTFAGADVELQAHFFSPSPVPPIEREPIPPTYQLSMQEIRMGNRDRELEKSAKNEAARRHARAENRERELKRAAAFQLASIVARPSHGAGSRVLQALIDRYGDPIEHHEPLGTREWSSPDARLLYIDTPGLHQVTYFYGPLQPTYDEYQERQRRHRAADL